MFCHTVLVPGILSHYLCTSQTFPGLSLKTFKDAVRTKDFAVSAEIYLRPDSDRASVLEQAGLLRESVDGILLTDNQFGQVHMSTIAAASILLGAGIDPIVQLSSRNRNRLALVSDLLGAAALGVTSLLLVAGEKAPRALKPRPKPVLDLTATDLIMTATTIKNDENLRTRPDFFVGGVVTPVGPKPAWKPKKMLEKIDAGAQYLQTHTCMDTNLLREYMQHLVSRKLIQRTSVIAAVAVLESADDARWLRENRPNVMIPEHIVERLEHADDPKKEGIRVCAETIRAARSTPGIDGVSIMATRDLASIPRALEAAGLAR